MLVSGEPVVDALVDRPNLEQNRLAQVTTTFEDHINPSYNADHASRHSGRRIFDRAYTGVFPASQVFRS